MIRHLFRLIWNRKKRNGLLLVEIFFSFLVLFAVASMAISATVKYFRPLGFSYKNVWILHLDWGGSSAQKSRPEIAQGLKALTMEMLSSDKIKDVSWNFFNHPYCNSTWRTILEWEGREVRALYFRGDDRLADLLQLKVIEGRWFNSEDDASSIKPIVLTRSLKEDLIGSEPAVGTVFREGEEEEYIVVGVTEDYLYRGEFDDYPEGGFFERYRLEDTTVEPSEVALLAVTDDADIQFEEVLLEQLSTVVPGWQMRITRAEDLRAGKIKDMILGIAIFGTIAGFLVLNVALGLFGVLWYSISRRRGEVGLRRAVGADAGRISGQILGETLVLSTLAVIAGVLLASQVPVLGLVPSIGSEIFAAGMACAAIMIYLLVALCALYPSWLAARIQPAEALHEE